MCKKVSEIKWSPPQLLQEAITLFRTPFYTFLGTFVPGGFCTIFKKMNQSPIARRMESASSVGWPQARNLIAFKFAYEFGDEKSTFLSQLGELYKTYERWRLPSGLLVYFETSHAQKCLTNVFSCCQMAWRLPTSTIPQSRLPAVSFLRFSTGCLRFFFRAVQIDFLDSTNLKQFIWSKT